MQTELARFKKASTSFYWKKLHQHIGFCLLFGLVFAASIAPVKIAAQTSPCISKTIPQSCLYLPMAFSGTTQPLYKTILAIPPPLDRPADQHGDINLALRSYNPTIATLDLINVNGPTDSDAPQLSGLFFPQRRPTFEAAHQVNDWDWNCGADGCRANPITDPDVTLLTFQTASEEPIYIPTRQAQIMTGGYIAMVLFAQANRITLGYTRDDTAAAGYVVHLENVRIDDELLTLYQASNAAGRVQLPALRNNQKIGVADGTTIKIAIRDTGQFMDPRSRKDWWRGY